LKKWRFKGVKKEFVVAMISANYIGIHVKRLTLSNAAEYWKDICECEKYWKDLSCEKKDIIE
jgi:hypothetical protein